MALPSMATAGASTDRGRLQEQRKAKHDP